MLRLLPADGWPTTSDWDIVTTKTGWEGSGKDPVSYLANQSYEYAFAAAAPVTGEYTVIATPKDNSTANTIVAKTSLSSLIPTLPLPTAVDFKLNSSQTGFDLKISSSAKGHNVYVSRQKTVGNPCTLISAYSFFGKPGLQTFSIPKSSVALEKNCPPPSLNAQDSYTFLLVSTEAPIETYVGRWNFAAPIGWSAVLGAASSNPGGNPDSIVASVAITAPNSNSLKINTPVQFLAVAKNASGTVLSGKTFSWSSSNPAIASVDNNGNVTAKRLGNVVISTSSEGKSASSASQSSYGLEITGGTLALGNSNWTSFVYKFKPANAATIGSTDTLNLNISGPAGWNTGTTEAAKLDGAFNAPFNFWDFVDVDAVPVSGTFTATTSYKGESFSANFSLNASSVLPKPTNIRGSGSTDAITANWNTVNGALSYYSGLCTADISWCLDYNLFTDATTVTFNDSGSYLPDQYIASVTATTAPMIVDNIFASDLDLSKQINFSFGISSTINIRTTGLVVTGGNSDISNTVDVAAIRRQLLKNPSERKFFAK
jgi:hypothetical protein